MAVSIVKLNQLFQTGHKYKILKDETEIKILENGILGTIIQEKEQFIKEIFSTRLYMESLVDKMVTGSKEMHTYLHDLLFQAGNLVFLYVLNSRRRRYILRHPERNINDILKDFDEDELFKWREECKKGMPIDYNFKLCKGTLSNFKGSKGCIGELSVVDSDSQDYDVIKFKAGPILNSWPEDDDTDEVYRYARSFKLAELKYKFLVYLTFRTICALDSIIGFELGMTDRRNPGYKNCLNTLKTLCQINENPSGSIPISREEWNTARNEELTILEYRTSVRRLGYSHFKAKLDSWSLSFFDALKMKKIHGMIYDYGYIAVMAPFGTFYNKYLQVVKRRRSPRRGVWTFGPIVCRLSKTMNRTV